MCACTRASISAGFQHLANQGLNVQPMTIVCLCCSLLGEPTCQLGRALCWAHLHPEELDLLPLLRHGRALGVRGRVPPVLGVCQTRYSCVHSFIHPLHTFQSRRSGASQQTFYGGLPACPVLRISPLMCMKALQPGMRHLQLPRSKPDSNSQNALPVAELADLRKDC